MVGSPFWSPGAVGLRVRLELELGLSPPNGVQGLKDLALG